jgi:hypothetical protein
LNRWAEPTDSRDGSLRGPGRGHPDPCSAWLLPRGLAARHPPGQPPPRGGFGWRTIMTAEVQAQQEGDSRTGAALTMVTPSWNERPRSTGPWPWRRARKPARPSRRLLHHHGGAADPIGGWFSTEMALPTMARAALAFAALTLADGCSTTATGAGTAGRPATTIAGALSTTASAATTDPRVTWPRASDGGLPGVHHPARAQQCIASPCGQMTKAFTSGPLAVRGRLYAETSRPTWGSPGWLEGLRDAAPTGWACRCECSARGR